MGAGGARGRRCEAGEAKAADSGRVNPVRPAGGVGGPGPPRENGTRRYWESACRGAAAFGVAAFGWPTERLRGGTARPKRPSLCSTAKRAAVRKA